VSLGMVENRGSGTLHRAELPHRKGVPRIFFLKKA